MYVAENTSLYPSAKWEEFVRWAMKVIDLCRRYGGKKVVFKEMHDSWTFLASDPQVQATLLRPENRDTVVAMYATNNPCAPELQMGGMIGLKHAGFVGDWGISTQYWNWSWGAHRSGQANWSICPADVILSMELAAGCLGARWFHIEGGQEYLVRGEAALSPRARRHRDLVYELIRKNILLAVSDEDNRSFSNVVVVRRFHPLVDELRASGTWLGTPDRRPVGPLRNGLLGIPHALQTVSPDFLSASAYGHQRCVQTMAPQTPYGCIRIVPDDVRVRPFLAGKEPLVTDGCDVFVAGKRTSAGAAREYVLKALQGGADKLPVRAPGAAVFTHRIGNGYRVFLLDPGYMCPQGVDTRLEIGLPGNAFEVHDLVTGEKLAVEDGRLPIRVPAFRVIEITPH